jgi:RNA polymerase sigma-70 factor (ECF subfamily)
MERAVASLPPGCRAAFILHDIEGFTHDEIAEQLGYTAGTSKSQVFRARRALRRMLASPFVEEPRHES